MKKTMLFLSGILIGIANLIPGVSGGTMALILGIYEEMILAIKKIRIDFLLPLGAGAVLAIVSGAKLLPYLMLKYSDVMAALFLGLIVASLKVTYGNLEKKTYVELIFAVMAFIIAFLIAGLKPGSASVNYPLLFISGFLGICAMILPGISGAAVLVIMGQYKPVLDAVAGLQIIIILVFLSGVLFGLAVAVKILVFLLNRYHTQTLSFLIGLMMGGIRSLRPSVIDTAVVASFLMGVAFILFFDKFSKYYKS